MRVNFPFSAIVGQAKLIKALLLCAVNESIGGLLIRGDKGTAKSTAVRGLADLLAPPAKFVDLPLGVTEDRLLGTIDFEQALKAGKKVLLPGLLAEAHGGILYIDEVNLLADHLVDALLDAAATGVNLVQREGLSFSHPARFILIGTMNPEEGNLRPQLLDRFAMTIDVETSNEPSVRAQVVRRRLAFDRDAQSFCAEWEDEQQRYRTIIQEARARLAEVELADEHLEFIGQICCQLGVESLRGDIVVSRIAMTLAALSNRSHVTVEDIREAAELALPQRSRFVDQPQETRREIEDAIERFENPQSNSGGNGCDQSNGSESTDRDSHTAPDREQVFGSSYSGKARKIQLAQNSAFQSGRRGTVEQTDRGRLVDTVKNPRPSAIAVNQTIIHSVVRNAGRLNVDVQDLHEPVRKATAACLITFIVDASGSMAAVKRMEAVKGAVLSLLQSAYECRDQVCVISFRGDKAEILVPPTSSVDIARQKLAALQTGGGTPLAHGLKLALEISLATRKSKGQPFLVLLTDGRANVDAPATGSPATGSRAAEACSAAPAGFSAANNNDPWSKATSVAATIAREGIPALVLDTESGGVRLGRAHTLAQAMGAEYMAINDLTSEKMTLTIRQRLPRSARGR